MAEQVTIATAADLIARLSTQAYTRLFARNGGSTVDTTFRDLCLAEANSMFRTMTRAAFPAGVYSTTDTLDPAIVGCVVDLACESAAMRHTSWDETSAYAAAGERARLFVKHLVRDADARAAGSSQSPPRPRANLANAVDASGTPTNPWTRMADGTDRSGF
jgi:hypothetical protein